MSSDHIASDHIGRLNATHDTSQLIDRVHAFCRGLIGPVGQALGICGALIVAWFSFLTALDESRHRWPLFLLAGLLFLTVTATCHWLSRNGHNAQERQ